MSKIVELSGYKCPPGCMAMHGEYGLVEVFATDGWMRGVVYEHHEELGLDNECEEVLLAEEISFREGWIHVKELKEANLHADILGLARRGQLLF